MTTSLAPNLDSAEDVNDFLRRVRELGEKRDKEDEERTRKLEEEILQGRKEREAQAERVGSISPAIESPLSGVARLNILSLGQRSIDSPSQRPDLSVMATGDPNADDTTLAPNTFKGKIRSELGYTQNVRERAAPISSTPPTEKRSILPPTNSEHPREPCRSQIAQNLASRDPSWFRQTPDRGLGSPALRKNPNGYHAGSKINSPGNRMLPGMCLDITTEPEKPSSATVGESLNSMSKASPGQSESVWGSRFSGNISATGGLGSAMPLSNAARHEPDTPEPGFDDMTTTPSSPPRRTSPERSISPTKGVGGFVQSAMMKRSDTVSKRFNSQMPSALNRVNSVVAGHPSPAISASRDVPSLTGGSIISRESSPLSVSRLGLSHNHTAVLKTKEEPSTAPIHNDRNMSQSDESLAKAQHSSPGSLGNPDSGSGPRPQTPSSPLYSRTMDPKRWSPTKSTWLESALNRPESPKQKSQSSQQPPWMQKMQSRGSVDMGQPTNFKEVKPVGLVCSTPPGSHSKNSSISGVVDGLANSGTRQTNEGISSGSPSPSRNGSTPSKYGSATLRDNIEDQAKDETDAKSPPTAGKQSPSIPSPTSNLSLLSSVTKVSVTPKPKPRSPVVDFRANLRRREITRAEAPKEEPEFKSAFGRLKKTETSNYVAPNEFKDNILRGKAALNVTSGPRKSQRADELKESILKKKEAMKTGGGSLRRNKSGENRSLSKPESVVPEAIARRNNLSKSTSFKDNPIIDKAASFNQDVSTSPKSHGRRSVREEVLDTPKQSDLISVIGNIPKSPERSVEATKSSKPVDIVDAEKEGPKTRQGDAAETSRDSIGETKNAVRDLLSERIALVSQPAIKPDAAVSKSALTSRINPALADILSRGRPAPGKVTKVVSMAGNSEAPGSNSQNPQSDNPVSGPALTHMTKGRARGPKRRPPKPAASDAAPGSHGEKSPSKVVRNPTHIAQSTRVASPTIVKREQLFAVHSETASTTPGAGLASKVSLGNKGLEVGHNSAFTKEVESDMSVGGAAAKLRSRFESNFHDTHSTSTLRQAQEGNRSASGKPAVPPKAASPFSSVSTSKSSMVESPLKQSAAQLDVRQSRLDSPGLPTQKPLVGLGIGGSASTQMRAGDYSFSSSSSSQVDVTSQRPSGRRPSAKATSPTRIPLTAEAIQTISKFFSSFPSSVNRVEIDPQVPLTNEMDDLKIRTLNKQIWEITGDGKRQGLPVNQEYILYEGSMYLCVHTFETDSTTRSEVHLWCGDDVGKAAAEDAQLFARKAARESDCKLEVLQQGRETARFIHALGGIMITRRGSGLRSNSRAKYMLCGRRHLQQMVFDEVDLSRKNLCSGYPFVIFTPRGDLYLWKGKGSGPEEVGAARLISMDLGSTGEIQEIAEGSEPASFFEIFHDRVEGKSDHLSADYWHLKPKHQHFRCRLFRVDHELGQRQGFWMRGPGSPFSVIRPNDTVQQIEPYCQRDISAKGIYVLDTFFEIYVIVGEEASQRPAEFASAVVFAHEYGILSVSLQDRPFIPRSFVAIGGVPESCLGAFRKWARLARPRTSVPKVLPLDAAIEAIRS